MQQNMKNGRKKPNYRSKLCYLLLISLCIGQMVYAQAYEQWKLQQEQHDIRLQQRAKATIPNEKIPALALQSSSSFTIISVPQQKESVQLGGAIQVNINRATAQELSAKLDSIGQKKAQAIVAYREKYGKFKRIDELKNVKGIGDKIYVRNQNRLKLQD